MVDRGLQRLVEIGGSDDRTVWIAGLLANIGISATVASVPFASNMPMDQAPVQLMHAAFAKKWNSQKTSKPIERLNQESKILRLRQSFYKTRDATVTTHDADFVEEASQEGFMESLHTVVAPILRLEPIVHLDSSVHINPIVQFNCAT